MFKKKEEIKKYHCIFICDILQKECPDRDVKCSECTTYLSERIEELSKCPYSQKDCTTTLKMYPQYCHKDCLRRKIIFKEVK